jgi:YegS/Rv2252/BmrU family lipid kinase
MEELRGCVVKKLLFIYNPHAGKAKMGPRLHEVVHTFQDAGYLVTVYETTAPRDATEVVRELGEDFDHVVCSGGDGTLSEVIAGLLQSRYTGALGYLPAGSTNDFSQSLELPSTELDVTPAARVAVEGVPFPCDIGMFNERSFVYVAAFGLFTAVSYETPQDAKNLFGHAAYVLEGIRSLAEMTPYYVRVEWDQGECEGDFIFGAVSNSVSVGGFKGPMSHRVVLDDGIFEVMLVRMPHSLPEMQDIITTLLTGESNDQVLCFQSSRVIVQSAQDIPWTLDGENGGRRSVADIRCVGSAVTMMRPRKEEP